jgi:hypothetical protein
MSVPGITVASLMLAGALCAQTNSPARSNTSPTHSTSTHPSTSEFTAACPSPRFPSATATPIDSQCGNDGDGGDEKAQNDAKNNFCPSNSNPQAMTIAQLADLQKTAQDKNIPFGNVDGHPITTSPGPVTDRAPLKELGEGKLVILEGYVKLASQEDAESVNCGKPPKGPANKPINHDIHISLVASLGQEECTGIIAEMIPHHRPAGWNPAKVNTAGTAGLKVRVTGQLMFDSSHTPCVSGKAVTGPGFTDPARVSLWEIHPIYEFEVCPTADCTSGGWVDLLSWTPHARRSEAKN